MLFRGFAPGSTVAVHRRFGDFMSPAHVRGLGEPLAEVEADGRGEAYFENLPAGTPLWVAGESPQGDTVVRRAQTPGHFAPGPEEVPMAAARQTQSANTNVNAVADERPDVRSTALRPPGRKPVPLDLARLAKRQPSRPARNPTPRHQSPQMGEDGGPPPPRGPGYDDDLGPAAA